MASDNDQKVVTLPTVDAAVRACTTARKADMFTYSGKINSVGVSEFINFFLYKKRLSQKHHENVSLFLTTYGGDAHAAYRLARALQSFYKNIRLLIPGPCKSAGTLVAIGANELAFGPFGELGPLDIQVYKKDDLMGIGSGLDTFQALAILQEQGFKAFEHYMLSILERSQGAISTKTACDIACDLVGGLFAPIAAQIDPQKMGEMERQIDIAKAYGERLGAHNLKEGALDQLVRDYPSHSFIIDYKEARSLFENVSRISVEEIVLVGALEDKGYCVLTPRDDILVTDVSDLSEGEGENETDDGIRPDLGPHDAGVSSQPTAPPPGSNAQRVPTRKGDPRGTRSKVAAVQ